MPVAQLPAPADPDRAVMQWQKALLVAELLATNPYRLRGASVRAGAGPVRDAWLEYFLSQLKLRHGQPATLHRLPLNASDDRLLGGIDLAATLAAGRIVAESGLLARASGGVLLANMAERMTAATSARLCAVIDTGYVSYARDGLQGQDESRFALILFDEGVTDDERPPAALMDRLAFRLDLREISSRVIAQSDRWPDANVNANAEGSALTRVAPTPRIDEPQVAALCGVALAFSISSLRTAQLAVVAASTCAAVFGRDHVSDDDITMAAELVLAPQAHSLPPSGQQSGDESTQDDECDEDVESGPRDADAAGSSPDLSDSTSMAPPATESPPPDPTSEHTDSLPERVLEAVQAAIPARLLAQLAAAVSVASHGPRSSGRAGQQLISNLRGRPLVSRRGDPKRGAKLDVLATLRAAAPWQALRRAEHAHYASAAARVPVPVFIRRDDWHVTRRAHRSETLTILAVDASGSAALHRLAEAKGAAELLLAECYVRRDQVAVVSFRGSAAETLLPPTRSLARAKRSLAALPGGGGTPLASGIDLALLIADAAHRRGVSPTLVFLTDGRANIARDGTPGRPQAAADALASAMRLRAGGFRVLMIDTSPEPQASARALADAMRASYLALPYAGAPVISAAVQSHTRRAR
jgi:magnesium chelatase subunit D